MRIFLGVIAMITCSYFSLSHAGSAQVSQSDFGSNWPLTVSKGTLSCAPLGGDLGIVTFSENGKTYAVNGLAKGRAKQNGWRAIDEIWKANPSVPGTKINIGPLIDRGLSLCK